MMVGCFGLAIAAVAGLFAYSLLRSPSPPPGEDARPLIAFVSDPPATHLDASYVVALRIQVHSCNNPVHVSAIVLYPSEFWQARSLRIGKATRIALAFAGPTPTNLHIEPVPLTAAGSALSGLTGAALTHLGDFKPSDLAVTYRPEAQRMVPTGNTILGVNSIFVASGTVTDWRQTFAALSIAFDAAWLMPRSNGSCFLVTPRLLSGGGLDPSDSATRVALLSVGGTIESCRTSTGESIACLQGPVAASRALVQVFPSEDTMLPGSTEPAAARNQEWNCSAVDLVRHFEQTTQRFGGARSTNGTQALRLGGYPSTLGFHFNNCSATVALSVDGMEGRNQLYLFILAATFALALTIVADVARSKLGAVS